MSHYYFGTIPYIRVAAPIPAAMSCLAVDLRRHRSVVDNGQANKKSLQLGHIGCLRDQSSVKTFGSPVLLCFAGRSNASIL
jgi:hypothetical protein